MATANKIIAHALGALGINAPGDAASADDAALCLTRLNDLTEAWGLSMQNAVTTREVLFPVTVSQTSYTIGPALQINIARPVRLLPGCYTRIGNIDYPMDVVDYAQYAAIELKDIGPNAWPAVIYYDANIPTGTVQVWPRPQVGSVLHLFVSVQVGAFPDLVSDVTLAPGYARALAYNLALEIAPDFERAVGPHLMALANQSLRTLKRVNHVVPTLDLRDRRQDPEWFARSD